VHLADLDASLSGRRRLLTLRGHPWRPLAYAGVMLPRLVLGLVLMLVGPGACGGTAIVDGTEAGSSSGSASGGAGGDGASGGMGGTGGAASCEDEGGLICEDWGCTSAQPSLEEGACYRRCTPSLGAVGEADDECDEPGRPYCGQVGDSLGGDFNCNGCHHVCLPTAGVVTCGQPADSCF
jgi:hypothetical protein